MTRQFVVRGVALVVHATALVLDVPTLGAVPRRRVSQEPRRFRSLVHALAAVPPKRKSSSPLDASSAERNKRPSSSSSESNVQEQGSTVLQQRAIAASSADKTMPTRAANFTAVKEFVEVFVANDGRARQLFDNGVVLPLGWTGASVRRRTGASLSPASSHASAFVESTDAAWPVGEASANPAPARAFRLSTFGKGLREDLKRRRPLYLSDWLDGARRPGKTLGAVLFLYFAVLAPAVAFGGVMSQVTAGALGPRDVLASCGVSGMAYAVLSGQPMTFLAPTGLTLSFIGALSAFTARYGVPFAPLYAWCGLWTSVIMMTLATLNASGLIRYCTRFTEDVFNALLAFNFVSEGFVPVAALLKPAMFGGGTTTGSVQALASDLSGGLTAGHLASSAGGGSAASADALLALDAAVLTAVGCRTFAGATRARYLTSKARSVIADFGPAIVIVAASLLLATPPARRLGTLKRLDLGLLGSSRAATEGSSALAAASSVVSAAMATSSSEHVVVGTSTTAAAAKKTLFSLVDLFSLSVPLRLLAVVPAVFLALLFYLDQHITVRTVNSPSHKLQKGAAYHADFFALGLVTGVASLFGLPWMCSATVQSLSHVRALSTYGSPDDDDDNDSSSDGSKHASSSSRLFTHSRSSTASSSSNNNNNAAPAGALFATTPRHALSSSSSVSDGKDAAGTSSSSSSSPPKSTSAESSPSPAASADDAPARVFRSRPPLPSPEEVIEEDLRQRSRLGNETETTTTRTARPFSLAVTSQTIDRAETKPAAKQTAGRRDDATFRSALPAAARRRTPTTPPGRRRRPAVVVPPNVVTKNTANQQQTVPPVSYSYPSSSLSKKQTPSVAGGGATAVELLLETTRDAQNGNANAGVGAPSRLKLLAGAGTGNDGARGDSDVASVVETRLTGFVVHALVLASLLVAPVLSEVPLAVVHGVFLFLGTRVIQGNQFTGRARALLIDEKRLDPSEETERAILELGRKPVFKFTLVQFACLATLWGLKLNKLTAMVFPSVIAVLLVLRATLLPRIFSARELLTLDTEMAI